MHAGARFLTIILASLLAMAGMAAEARGHDIGAMRVRLSRSAQPDAAVAVEVLVDLDHVPSAVRSSFFEHLVAAS
ncbi:MAG: hypothetical protein NTV94_11500, partial [Planctomycetota bacterium]|nr:hypothetical protein [Planctomycetota bacterium]